MVLIDWGWGEGRTYEFMKSQGKNVTDCSGGKTARERVAI